MGLCLLPFPHQEVLLYRRSRKAGQNGKAMGGGHWWELMELSGPPSSVGADNLLRAGDDGTGGSAATNTAGAASE